MPGGNKRRPVKSQPIPLDEDNDVMYATAESHVPCGDAGLAGNEARWSLWVVDPGFNRAFKQHVQNC